MNTKVYCWKNSFGYVGWICCFFLSIAWHINAFSGEKKTAYPEIGIMSKDSSDHVNIRGMMAVSKAWASVVNKSGLVCKKFHERITMEELKEMVVFDDADLLEITDDKKNQYGESSEYFKSCNYEGYYYDPLFNLLNPAENVLLEWPSTDAYIDTEYSLLLIDYLDENENGQEDNKKYVRALFIDKRHQFHSNKKSEESLWGNLKKLSIFE